MRPILLLATILFNYALLQAQIRTVLVEIKTATWCPACPQTDVYSDALIASHPGDVLVVAVHSSDVMEAMGGAYINALDISGLPYARVDRGVNQVDLGSALSGAVNNHLNQDPSAGVVVTRTYDPVTRLLSVTLNVSIFNTLPAGDYRLGGIVVENGVTGTSSAYAQSNMFSGDTQPMGGYEDLPDPVPASMMVYDHVGRYLLGGYDGVAGIIPSAPQAGQTFSHTFTYTIPSGSNDEKVRVYGIMTNATTGEVLNAGASPYAGDNINDPPNFVTNDSLQVLIGQVVNFQIETYDADQEQMQIQAVAGLPSWATIEMENGHEAVLSGTATQSGVFNITLQVSDGIAATTQNFVLRVDGIYDPWTPIGTTSFTDDDAESFLSAAVEAATGKVHVAYTGDNSKIKVQKWNGTTWAQVGNQMTASYDNAYVDVAIHPTLGRPWIAYQAGVDNTRVMKWDGQSWTQAGDLVPGSSSQDLAITDGGTVYLATSLGDADLRVHQWDGSSWVALGGNSPISIPDVDGIGWPRLAITSNAEPVMAFRAHNSATQSDHVYVARWNGSTWDLLGSTPPCPLDAVNPASAMSSHQIATGPDGSIHVAIAHATGIHVYSFNGNTWELVGEHVMPAPPSFSLLAGGEGRLILTHPTIHGRLSCLSFDGASWSSWGDNFSPRIAWGRMNTFMFPNGDPGVVYADLYDGSNLSAERLTVGTIGMESVGAGEPSTMPAYPNPTSGRLYIAGTREARKQALILDVSGRMVARARLVNGYIDVPHLEPGTYTVQFPEDGTSLKFVKE